MEIKKMNKKITHQKNKKIKILMQIKFLNLTTVEAFSNQKF